VVSSDIAPSCGTGSDSASSQPQRNGAGNYAFNDLHAMMTFVGAGRLKEQRAVLGRKRNFVDR
jgi:hypothetical protein